MLLPAELRGRLERLSLVTRRRVIAQWAGRHRSRHKGESLDFADYRQYVPGDDFRRIDHNLWARLGVLLVRQFEAEEELPLRVVLDVSKSMGFYRKAEIGKVLAGMIVYLGLAGGDRVQVYAVGGASLQVGPAGRHLSRWPQLEAWLEQLPTGGGGELAPTLRKLVGEGTTRGALILVSDLLSPDFGSALDGLGIGAGGIILHVLGPEELDPGLAGDLRLADSESGGEVEVSTSEEAMRRYRAALEAFATEAAARARRAGLDYVLVPATDDAPMNVLSALSRTEALV
ncbi:MAG: DUF58 domain-containing protein [Acidimicrobiia bacterium]